MVGKTSDRLDYVEVKIINLLSLVAVGVLRRGHNVGLGVLGVGDVGADEADKPLRVDGDVLPLDDVVPQELDGRQHLLVRRAAAVPLRRVALPLVGVALL